MEETFSFRVWHEITEGFSGEDRARLFTELPEWLQEAAWDRHAEECAAETDRLCARDWPFAERMWWEQPPKPKVQHLRPVPSPPSRSLSKSEIALMRASLVTVPAETFVERLAGVEVPSHRMIRCPLPDHEDRTPSCRVYDQSWRCFGCDRGGSVFELAAGMWGFSLPLRGADFVEVLKRLAPVFAVRQAA